MKKPGINKTLRLDIPLVTEVTLYRSEDWEERPSFVIIGKKKYEIETFNVCNISKTCIPLKLEITLLSKTD